MRFQGLDLNLLHVLDTLLTERSVTAAAKRLNLSQPATSSALAKLRAYFGDELLQQSGRFMLPTAQALTIQPLVRETLADVKRLIATSSSFDPATSHRTFTVAGSDYVYIAVLAPLIGAIQAEAPHVQFDAQQMDSGVIQLLERGDVDLVLTPRHFTSPDHPAIVVFEETHVVVGWNQNPLFAGQLTLEQFLSAPQVTVELGPTKSTPFAEEQMHAMGLKRKIEVVTPTFAAVPWLLPNSTRIAVMQKRLALKFFETLPLAISPLPFDMPLMEEMAQFHQTRSHDPGLQWLLARLQEHAGK